MKIKYIPIASEDKIGLNAQSSNVSSKEFNMHLGMGKNAAFPACTGYMIKLWDPK